MIWTHAKAVTVLAAVGTSAQGFLSNLNQQLAAWILPPTTSSSTPQTGSPPIGGPAAPGDGANASGTIIISWSTQYFTVTTSGYAVGSQGTINDGGGRPVIPTGSLDLSQAPGAGTVASGVVTTGLPGDAGSQTEPNNNGGNRPPVLTEGLGPSASVVSGAPAGGLATGGLPGGDPKPASGSTADEEFIGSVLAGGVDNPQQASVSGAIPSGTVTAGFSGNSQTDPNNTDGGGSVPPTQNGSPGSSDTSAPGTLPSESALSSPDIFVIQLGPAGADVGVGAAVESGAAGPLRRRQVNNDNKDNEYLMNAGTERSVDCSQATQFEIVDGELTRGGQKVSASPGTGSARRLAVSPTVGSITRSWEIVDGELLWVNDAFVGGRAEFCVDDDTRAVFFTISGEVGVPAGCTPQKLTPMFVADCPGLNPDGSIGSLLPAEETMILPPGIYIPGREPKGQACRVTTEYWTVGQFTLAPDPTGLSRRL